jgi:Bacterial transglutaminase-like N-terminal region
MPTLTIHHKTEYRYARPVAFGEHRIMLRPRDGHDLRVLSSELDRAAADAATLDP